MRVSHGAIASKANCAHSTVSNELNRHCVEKHLKYVITASGENIEKRFGNLPTTWLYFIFPVSL